MLFFSIAFSSRIPPRGSLQKAVMNKRCENVSKNPVVHTCLPLFAGGECSALKVSLFSSVFTPGPWGHKTTTNKVQTVSLTSPLGTNPFKKSVWSQRVSSVLSACSVVSEGRTPTKGMWEPHGALYRDRKEIRTPEFLCGGALLSAGWAVIKF